MFTNGNPLDFLVEVLLHVSRAEGTLSRCIGVLVSHPAYASLWGLQWFSEGQAMMQINCILVVASATCSEVGIVVVCLKFTGALSTEAEVGRIVRL